MLSEKFSHLLDKPLAPIAKAFPINPNLLTLLGMLITSSSALVIPNSLFWGGILVLFGGAFDMIDGLMARVNGRATKFGALLDSTLDRIADGFIFVGVGWYFFRSQDEIALLVTFLCMVSSFLISYIRARAEGLGISCNVGLIERPERILFLAFGCLTGWLFLTVTILTILSIVTVIQRMIHVKRGLENQNKPF